MMGREQPFWKQKPLQQMTQAEWESLCDGCAKCCLVKLQDDETGEIAYTSVGCQYLDPDSCRCSEYARRQQLVAECIALEPEMSEVFAWLPDSCAYRLVAEGRELPRWHPLISGDPDSVHASGNSVQHRIVSERDVDPDDLEEFIVYWVE